MARKGFRSPGGWTEAPGLAEVPSTPQPDRIVVAAELVDRLRKSGHDHLVDNAVFVLSHHKPTTDKTAADARTRALEHFRQQVRQIVEVPFDPAIDAGGPIEIGRLSPVSRRAWLTAAAAVAEGL